ncbi:hypothetical protein COEREDRAFT_81985 [Coemansia reversa NRRL 1564]|uniref:PCI domain-containing protein n=1 Tax=Coemansia reversa (strain ATCC 12441 / NRRL 1564) TaxID=763665 RepID=A0A2G5B8X6_COERN|nr:hypothetical protein COEREDRAFT_81985 [Coemansia reversa NRRL 1564]|eukprot:PIA15432.1 hypothetical protein COEREDRAFT_81985 [Coemansia reversa NRRL 1564]
MPSSTRLSKARHKFKALNNTKNGEELADVIKLDSLYTERVLSSVLKEDGCWDAVNEQEGRGVWDEVAIAHFQAAAAYQQRNFTEAYKYQLASYNAFLRLFRNMSRWGIQTLFSLCKDLCDVAKRADKQQPTNGGVQSSKVEEATRAINQGFSLCMTDREPQSDQSRKWGTYHMANILFALYQQLGAQNLCSSMISAIKASELPGLSSFPMSDQVTFRYYRGVLAFRKENYKSAKEDLMFALEHCHRDSYNNKTRILIYLTPVLLAEGKIPASRLMRRYPTIKAVYGEIAKAAKIGNVRKFDDLLKDREQQYVVMGTFLALERSRRVALRQLLRKIYLIDGSNSRIHFQRLCDGFVAAGLERLEVAEMEAILADMIFNGYIKGYLAHDHGIAVLSKQQPFPPLGTLT